MNEEVSLKENMVVCNRICTILRYIVAYTHKKVEKWVSISCVFTGSLDKIYLETSLRHIDRHRQHGDDLAEINCYNVTNMGKCNDG